MTGSTAIDEVLHEVYYLNYFVVFIIIALFQVHSSSFIYIHVVIEMSLQLH